MRFGRVVGTVSESNVQIAGSPNGHLVLIVTLDDGKSVETVRSERVPVLDTPPGNDRLTWQADQYTQETIGNELAVAGWEPIGIAFETEERSGATIASSSPTYLVRLL